MTWLIGLALKAGIPARFAKAAVIAILVALAVSAIGLSKCAYDRSIIKAHDAKQEAAAAKADRKADAKAAEQRRSDDARSTAEDTQIKEAVNEAKRTGGDLRRAYYDCVRAQQAARRTGQPPAGC